MLATLHTPGTHYSVLDRVDIRISPARKHHMVRLRYRYPDELASIHQHILWSAPESSQIPEIGAYILSRIFSNVPIGDVERSTSFWGRMEIEDVVEYLQKYIGKIFKVVVIAHAAPETSEVFPRLKLAFYMPDGIPKTPTPKGA